MSLYRWHLKQLIWSWFLSIRSRHTPITLANPTRALAATSDLMPAPRKTAVEKKTTALMPENCWIRKRLAPTLTTAKRIQHTTNTRKNYSDRTIFPSENKGKKMASQILKCKPCWNAHWNKIFTKAYLSSNACWTAPPTRHLARQPQNRHSLGRLSFPRIYSSSPTTAWKPLLLPQTFLAGQHSNTQPVRNGVLYKLQILNDTYVARHYTIYGMQIE